MKISKILSWMFIAAFALAIAGCAGVPLVLESAEQVAPPPPPDQAQIIFLNPSNSIAGAFLTGVYDLKNNDKEFLGMLGSKMKVVQNVAPGKHLFMAHTVAYTHFLNADVEAGKRYYVLLRFIYARGMQLRPIRVSGDSEFSATNPKFEEWKNDSKFVSKTPGSGTWYTQNKNVIDEAQAKGWAEWEKKTPEQKAELSLNKTDYFVK